MCPITKSAKKALRQSKKRRIKNLQKKEIIKSLFKKVKGLISQKKIEEAKKLLPEIYKLLDKGVKTGLIKKNTASRKKSRITKLTTRAVAKGEDEARASSTTRAVAKGEDERSSSTTRAVAKGEDEARASSTTKSQQ